MIESDMHISIDIPDELSPSLAPGHDPARAALEALGLEAYRLRRISGFQLRTLLRLPSRWDLHALLKERQIDTVRYLDGVFAELFDLVPKNTHIIVTADHGELFGEAGYFGHGPIMHDKCYEVPYLEGKVR